jgi:hypothetical protein
MHLKTAAERGRRDAGVVAEDDPLVLQPPHPPQTRRRGEPDTVRKFGVRQAGVPAELFDYCAIRPVHKHIMPSAAV